MRSTALIPVVVVLGNMAALGTQIILPHVLPNTEYARFSVQWAYGQLIAVLGFEWLRQATLRFSVSADASVAASRRRILFVGYVGVGLILVASGAISACLSPRFATAASVAAVLLYAASQGSFDGAQALARAEAANSRFSSTWIVRTFLSFALAVAVAQLTRSGLLTTCALALAFPLSLLPFHYKRLRLPNSRIRTSEYTQMKVMLQFGVLAALTGTTTALFPPMIRSMTSKAIDLQSAAGLLLSLDVSQKVISVIGLAVNVVVSQQTIRSIEFESESDQQHQKRAQISITSAVIFPAAVGFILVQPSLLPLLAPPPYRAAYIEAVPWACTSAAIIAIRAYGVDPLLITSRRYATVLIGPIATLVAAVFTFAVMRVLGAPPSNSIYAAIAVGPAVGLACSVMLLLITKTARLPLSDLVKIGFASGLFAVALLAMPDRSSPWSLAMNIAIGAGIYSAVGLVLNTCGLRDLLFSSGWPSLRAAK